MAKERPDHPEVAYLKKLEKNTVILKLDLKGASTKSVFREYAKVGGNFNKFLEQHEAFSGIVKKEVTKRVKEEVEERIKEGVAKRVKEEVKERIKEGVEERSREEIDKRINEEVDKRINEEVDRRIKEEVVVVAELTGGSIGFDTDDKYSSINVDGADFTGCIFKGVEFHSMNNVFFRNAVLEDVRIMGGEFSHIDFRGSRLANCEFFGGGKVHKLESIQLAFANSDKVQDKGLFTIEDDTRASRSIMELEARLGQARRKEIRKYLIEENKKVGWLWRRNPDDWGKSWNKKDLTEAQQAHITEIEERYEKRREEESLAIRHKCFVRFDNPTLDPTYTPNQIPERAAAIKVPLVATRKDLEEYQSYSRVKGNEPISFNDFIAQKYSKELEEVRFDNQNTMVVPVVELTGQDLSKMDLSGLDLRGIDLSYCNMKDCKFYRAKLTGSCLEGCKVEGTRFNEANLMDCNMIGIAADENTSFEKAVIIRTQLNVSELKGAKLDGAIGYLASFRGSDMERSSLVEADLERSDFSGVNLNYVDAKYANLRMTNLTGAIADKAKFIQTDLTNAIANGFRAQEAIMLETVLNGIQAHFADLRHATLEKVKARGADFSDADLRWMKALDKTDFEGAVLERANASFAEFIGAILTDAKARNAIFTEADLRKIEAERIDIREAVLDYAKLQKANLKAAKMEAISAIEAKFIKAILKEANIRRGVLIGADLEEADVTQMEFDKTTILIDANLRGLKGDDKTKNELWEQQKEQHASRAQLFGESRYGRCKSITNGINDRFICQKLGAALLSGAIAYGAAEGVTLSGPLAGIPAATLATLISSKALDKIKDAYFSDRGYINNSLGDRLAEVGAIAMSMGVGAADKAIDGAAAGAICSLAGMVGAAAMSATGIGAVAMGLKVVGNAETPKWRKWTGNALIAAGGIATTLGFTSAAASLNAIAYTTVAGAAMGAAWAGWDSAKRLYNYNDKSKDVGARPEQIYKESLEKSKGIWTKHLPTKKKILVGLLLAAVAAPVGFAAAQALLVTVVGTAIAVGAGVGLAAGVNKGKTRASKIGYGIVGAALGGAAGFMITEVPFIVGVVKTTFAVNAAISCATVGFAAGYVFDDKILPVKEPIQFEAPTPNQKVMQGEVLAKEAHTKAKEQEPVKPAQEQEPVRPAQEPGSFVKRHPKKEGPFVDNLPEIPKGPAEKAG